MEEWISSAEAQKKLNISFQRMGQYRKGYWRKYKEGKFFVKPIWREGIDYKWESGSLLYRKDIAKRVVPQKE